MDEFVDGGNGNMMFDDDVMADDNCFLSPARDQDFLNTNQNNDLLGMDENNMNAVLNQPQQNTQLNPLTDNAGSLDDLNPNQGASNRAISNIDPLEAGKNKPQSEIVESKQQQNDFIQRGY